MRGVMSVARCAAPLLARKGKVRNGITSGLLVPAAFLAATGRCMRHVFALVLIGVALPVAGGSAATLRTMTLLHAPVVRLSDLFNDAGLNANRVLGSAPGPGGRIVVEAPQLVAIAREFDVEWRPTSPADQTVLERPGRLLSRDQVMDAVRAAVIAVGASPGCDISLLGFTPPLVPEDAKPQPTVADVDYDRASGRFAALLVVTGTGMEPVNLRISGQVDEVMELPVAISRLPAGAVLRPDDVRLARVHLGMVHGEVTHALSEAVGMQLRHPVAAGEPFSADNLMRPTMVRSGSNVAMGLVAPGISLRGEGVAMDSGAVGERIRVLNPTSRAIVQAEVIGPGQVRVAPDGIPLSVTSRGVEDEVR
jgi:flagella basal body P-ring formation protein FlgA